MNFVYLPVTIRQTVVLLALTSTCVWAQAAKEFDVASIKPHKGADDGRVGIQITPGGLLRASNMPLRELLQMAYDLRPGQLTGAPKWIDSERYDIEAKMSEPPAQGGGPDFLRPYMQSLLEKRFQLKSHREMRDMQSYQLVQGKGAPKLKESDPASRGPMIRMGRDQLTLNGGNMDQLSLQLSRAVGAPVSNQTGLTGQYDMELKFTPERPAPPGPNGARDGGGGAAPGGDAPSIFTAVQEQLGLNLESKKGPISMFVVDKIEKPEEN